jgi:hypothetical protein
MKMSEQGHAQALLARGRTHGGYWKGGTFGRIAGVGCLERRRRVFGLLWRQIWSNVMLGPSSKLRGISIISVSSGFSDNCIDLSVSVTIVLGQELGQLWFLRAHFPAAFARLWYTSSRVTKCSPQDLWGGWFPASTTVFILLLFLQVLMSSCLVKSDQSSCFVV